MPLTKPAVAAVGVFSFIHHWNDFMSPLIFTNREETRTLALGLRYFGDEQFTEFRLVMAVATLMLVPVLVVSLPPTNISSPASPSPAWPDARGDVSF